MGTLNKSLQAVILHDVCAYCLTHSYGRKLKMLRTVQTVIIT